jgi:hypothetical protein
MAEKRVALAGGRAAAFVVLAAGLLLGAAVPSAAAESLASQGSAAGVTYSAATVVVPKSVVAADLRSVSPNGATYTFSSDTGVLRRLKKGSVMLLQGTAVRDVTSVSKKGAELVVSTTPAAITDLISNGTLTWNKAVDFANAYAIGGPAVPIETARDTDARDALLSRFGLRALAGHKFTLKGSTHSYKYSVTFTSEGKAVGVDITISKSTAVDLSVTISGTLDGLSSAGAIALRNQRLNSAHTTASGLKGQFKISYSVKPLSQFGLGNAGGIKITLPAEITLPFSVGAVPFFLGVKTAFFASVGFSNFDQSVNGSYTINYEQGRVHHLEHRGHQRAGCPSGSGQDRPGCCQRGQQGTAERDLRRSGAAARARARGQGVERRWVRHAGGPDGRGDLWARVRHARARGSGKRRRRGQLLRLLRSAWRGHVVR